MEIVHQDMYRYQFHPTTLVVTTLDRGSESDDEIDEIGGGVVGTAAGCGLWVYDQTNPNQGTVGKREDALGSRKAMAMKGTGRMWFFGKKDHPCKFGAYF